MFIIFSFSLLSLLYIYSGYYFILKFISIFIDKPSYITTIHEYEMGVSIYFPAFNEEETVLSRLENLISCDYPTDKMEIIVISDGSTDNTVPLVNEYIQANNSHSIKLINLETNHGQAYIQNLVIKESKYDILISTDADSEFEPSTIRNLVKPFQHEMVGVVGGLVRYMDSKNSNIGTGYNKYRGLEESIREYEMRLGVLCKTDGPCTAYRTSIWKDIEDFEDVDQVITIFAANANLKSIQVNDAICFDKSNSTSSQDIKQRSRMTRKALLSTFNRLTFSSFVKHPLFWLALFSHKIVRFFSPVFLMAFLLSLLYYVLKLPFLYLLFTCLFSVTVLIVINKYINNNTLNKYSNLLHAFYTAQKGFAIGIISWVRGDKSGRYTPTRKQL